MFDLIHEHPEFEVLSDKEKSELHLDHWNTKKQEEYDEHKEKKIKEAISSFYDYKDMAEQFYKIQPIYYDKSKLWFLWSFELKKWEIIDETDLFILLDKAIDSGTVNTTKSHIKSEIIECLKREGRKNKPKEPKVEWIQFKNYVYDIYTRERFEPTPKYFFTNPIQWNIGETVDTPVMDKLFKEWVGKKNVEMLYEIIAYSLYRDYPIHRIFCLIGGGRNGKSKYLELINRFIGKENSSSTELDQLLLSRFEVAKMYRKLVCMMGETNYTAMEKTALLKKLTGQDLIGYEFKQKNPFDDYNYAKIMIATNSIPVTHDKTDGFYRRWLIIDFPNQFPEGKNILEQIPDEEYENLALKSVVILKMLLEEGRFTNELSIEDKKVVYEEKSNPLSLFLKEYTLDRASEEIFKSEFNAKLLAWLNKNGYRTLNNQEINGLMRENYHDKKTYNEEGSLLWVWQGLMWKKNEIIQEIQEIQ
jgi:P4 family phage/plasmid primase-like protien